MKFSIKNMKYSVCESCKKKVITQNLTEFCHHMYSKNAVFNGKQKQMKPLHVEIFPEHLQFNLNLFACTFPNLNKQRCFKTPKFHLIAPSNKCRPFLAT